MTAPRCLSCRHPEHMHGATGCAASDVTGPPCDQGRGVGDGYDHGGRTVTPCDCNHYAQLETT